MSIWRMLTSHQEFAGLWKYISDWQNVFRHFDRDRSGSIDGHELADALRNFGYNLSPMIMQLLEQKYGAPQDPELIFYQPLTLQLKPQDRHQDTVCQLVSRLTVSSGRA